MRLYNQPTSTKKLERLKSDVSDLSHSVVDQRKKAFGIADDMVKAYCQETAKSFDRSNCNFTSS